MGKRMKNKMRPTMRFTKKNIKNELERRILPVVRKLIEEGVEDIYNIIQNHKAKMEKR